MSSLSEYYNLTPRERAAWKQHFRKYPPGDFLVQRLLAILISMVGSIGGGKNVKPQDIAPWLDWENETENEKTDTLEMQALQMIMDLKQDKE